MFPNLTQLQELEARQRILRKHITELQALLVQVNTKLASLAGSMDRQDQLVYLLTKADNMRRKSNGSPLTQTVPGDDPEAAELLQPASITRVPEEVSAEEEPST